MPEIIRNRELVADDWHHVADDHPLPEGGRMIVSWHRWQAELEGAGEVPRVPPDRLGVVAPGDTEPEQLARLVGHASLIALRIPKFADGRHFTSARLLRERFGFEGELRATGDVVPDQVFYMHRVGYNAFELPPGPRRDAALSALDTFSVTYQAAVAGRPLHRSRL